jgi:hypothetical protein
MKGLLAKLQKLFQEYGGPALVVWFGLFGLTLVGFVVALSLGVRVEGVAGKAGVFGAAYVATQLTKPLRILATLALTPLVAQAWRKLRAPAPPPAS